MEMIDMKKIRYITTLLAVSDMEKSKAFYENILEQKVEVDLGTTVAFECGLALNSDYSELISGEKYTPQPTGIKIQMTVKPNNSQLVFEVEDFDEFVASIRAVEGIEILHDVVEYNWGQRVMRIYDYDKHIVEIDERWSDATKRLYAQGLTIEEIAKRNGTTSLEHIQKLLES